jgi:hypothetical protein
MTEEELLAAAKKYNRPTDFWNNDRDTALAVYRRGLKEKAFAHMTDRRRTWTPKAVREEAAKHNTRSAFKKAAPGAVRKARALGIFEEITAHMDYAGTWEQRRTKDLGK